MNHNIKPYQADDVYLHKLVNYKDLFEIIFDNIKFDSVCEIGIETGEFSSILEDYIKDGVIKEYHGVDVCITKKIGFNSHYHEMTSLEYLTSEEHLGHDLYLVDGDHNYYTVTAELENIFSAASGKKICILHDTNWPCGRRDFYYNPAQIPAEATNPLSWDKKLVRSSSEMQELGFYGNGSFAISEVENTPKNGVMTAIEDFISSNGKFKTISFPQFLGVTILFNEDLLSPEEVAVFSDISALIKHDFIANSLHQLEYNRLDIYTKLLSAYQAHENSDKIKDQEILKLAEELDTLGQQLQRTESELEKRMDDNNKVQEEMVRLTETIEDNRKHSRFQRRYLISEMENAHRIGSGKVGTASGMNKLANYVKFNHASLGKKFEKDRRIQQLADFSAKTGGHKLVTFDFFDTLVIRPVEPPERVKDKIAEISCDILCGLLKMHISVAYYHELRAFYERKLRDETLYVALKDHETTLTLIVEELLRHLGIDESSLVERLVEAEIQLEIDVLKANEGALELLRILKQNDKRIVVISDMYLPRRALVAVAENLGMSEYIDEFYVSGDIGYAKYSSRLFTHVAEVEGVATTDMVHLGDNFTADYVSPGNVGVASYWLHQKPNLTRRYLAEKNMNGDIHSVIDGLISQAMPASSVKQQLVAAYYKVFAPAVFSMAYKNLKDGIRLGVKNFYFLAREGIAFKTAYDLLLATHPEFQDIDVTTTVLYVSRASSICSRYQGKDKLGVVIGTVYERFGYLSYDNLLNAWSIREDEFDYQPAQRPNINTPEDICILFEDEDFFRSFDRYQRKAQENLRGYLQQAGVFEHPCFFVDIGWGGTIQKNIQLLEPDCELLGAYIGTDARYGLNSMKGYLFNEYDPRTKMIIKSAPVLEELLSVGSVNSTLYYQQSEEGVIPVFKSGEAAASELEIMRNDIFKQFAQTFKQLTRDYCVSADEMLSFTKDKLYRFVTKPEKAFIREIEEVDFEFNWGDSQKYKLIKPVQKRMLLRPRAFYHHVLSSPWLFATLKVSGLGMLNRLACQVMHIDPRITAKLSNGFKGLYYGLRAKLKK
ncbi:HAD family hydrolase [Serratia rubidaea]|uniref:HAD family hydrolase n=1 Tax=Serratia rubidaea TaxID=61652 RepID=UPI0022B8C63D|nr:HAD family hydrolase [Serratia rubidaea]WBF44020.1 HAD hydrolase-like protein [Serratia rubidaea]